MRKKAKKALCLLAALYLGVSAALSAAATFGPEPLRYAVIAHRAPFCVLCPAIDYPGALLYLGDNNHDDTGFFFDFAECRVTYN